MGNDYNCLGIYDYLVYYIYPPVSAESMSAVQANSHNYDASSMHRSRGGLSHRLHRSKAAARKTRV